MHTHTKEMQKQTEINGYKILFSRIYGQKFIKSTYSHRRSTKNVIFDINDIHKLF